MHMIGHQDIRMHLACRFGSVLASQRKVDQVICIAGKAWVSIVTPLDDVKWYRGKYQSWTSRHGIE
jgi:hypothetical protein